MSDNQTGYISNNSDAITFEYKNEHGELVTDPNLEVISFGYRADGSLKWLDVFDTSQNKVTRYNACVMEDIVYLHWGGQYVWTDINCHRLEVGGGEFEELVDTVEELDENALRKQNNLNDVSNKQTALGNLECSAATPASAADYGYDTTTQQSKSNIQVQTTWDGGIPMAVPFKDFADTVIDTSANPLPISKGGTNAQTEDSAVYNLLGNDTTSVLDTAVRDDGVLPYRCDSAYAQGSNFGKVSLSQIWDWLHNTKETATIEDVNSITAKYITSSAAGAAFADEAALAGDKYYAGQIITTSTSPALGNNDYCIVLDSGASHDNATARYVYQEGAWVFQYVVSQVTLNQAQLDALNSGITSSKVSAYDNYETRFGITITESGGIITSRSFNGTSNNVANAITFSNDGAGAASGSTFDGSAAQKLSYNSIGAAAAKDVYAFTYIVDNNTKLSAWANNTPGNDYTSVLVKRNPNSATGWSVNKGINLTATGTKVVVGEAGSALSINGNNTTIDGAFGYQSIIDSPDYYMFGVTIIAQGTNSGHAMQKCSNLINCIAYGKTNKIGFSNCEHLINCGADGIHAYNACKDVMSCRIVTRGTVTRDHAFINCLSVRYCKVPSGTYNNSYSQSYSSPTINATYACANTLEGGWNQ